jgi:hypothetical protein
MKDYVLFHLAKFAPLAPVRPYVYCDETLYDQIKSGKKTVEYREVTRPWLRLLCNDAFWRVYNERILAASPLFKDLTEFLRVHRARFVYKYPKDSVPRLEADITGLSYDPVYTRLQIHVANVREVVAKICGLPVVIDEKEPNWRLELSGDFKA